MLNPVAAEADALRPVPAFQFDHRFNRNASVMESSDISCSSLMIATTTPSFDARIMSNE